AGLAQPPAELPPAKNEPELAPPPRLFELPPGDICPAPGARVPGQRQLGAAPQPGAETLKEFGQFVEQAIEPQNTLDVVVGQSRLLMLKEVPTHVQLLDDKAATYTVVTEREISVAGKAPGTTVLNLFFGDPKDGKKRKVLSYLVRVLPDPEAKARLEAQLKVL